MTLADLLDRDGLFADGDWVESKDQDPEGDVRLIQLADVGDGIYIDKSSRSLTSAKARELKCTFLKEGDILVARMPDPLGRACMFPGDYRPCVTVVDVCIVRPGPSVDRRWLLHAINSPAFRTQIDRHIKGTTRQRISRTNLGTVELTVPPFPEQRRIADILDKADAIRRKRKEAIALTEDLLRSAFLEMFGDPVTNPKKWPPVPLAKLARVVTGNTPSRAVPVYFGDDIEWIKSDNINTPSHYVTRATEGLSATGKEIGRTAPSGSTLMTCIAGSPNCIGNVALADREVAFNQQINAMTPYEGVDYRFLYVMLLVGKSLVQAASTNSMKGMVSKGKLEQVQFPAPPSQMQVKFGEVFDRIVRLSRRQELAEDDSKFLFESLLGHAFRGGSARPNVIGSPVTDVAAR
jgi:type I restriction enzyme S subunit